MPSKTIENYLKQLYLEQQSTPAKPVAMGKLASAMNVVPGTATTMVKALADSGLVRYEPRTGVKLTDAGRQLALHVLRRHRLVELFLVQVVGLDWSEVHDEAEELEHAISDKLLERIDTLLGHPTVDPHGDPIPTASGELADAHLHSFVTCQTKSPQTIARVLDQNTGFLKFVNSAGLTPGTQLEVIDRDDQADSVRVRPRGKKTMTISTSAAAKFLVKPGRKA